MPQTFYITLKALIRNNDKYLLLVKERGGKNYWDMPGGRVEVDDTFTESLTRELQEEIIGIDKIIIKRRLDTVWELPKEFVQGSARQLTLFYLVDADVSKINLSDEHSDFVWVDVSSLSAVKGDKDVILLDGYEQVLQEVFGR